MQYYFFTNSQAYSLLGSILNMPGGSSFTFLAATNFPVAVVIRAYIAAVATLVASVIFCTVAVVSWQTLFSYAF